MSLPPWLTAFAPRTAPRALAWYIVIALAFTWPLATGLDRYVARDLGDPLLNAWILGWNADHFLQALKGHPEVLSQLWHGNIFHPEPYALAYSELLLAPAAQILPVYAATSNLVLCYNLLFVSTYFLSGLGAFLLARAYTRDWRSAFIAGLIYAFTPYRVNQGPHLQVMSSQWMPLALYGLHRFIVAGNPWATVGGAMALVAQNLSCGYFLIFFAPFVPAFVLVELVRTGAWRNWRIWAGLAGAALLVAAFTLPTMAPYTALRALHGTRRSIDEILFFSPDVWSWLAADDLLLFWGPRLQVMPKPEGQLFPGLVPILLAVLGIVTGGWYAWRASRAQADVRRGFARRAVIGSLTVLFVVVAVLAASVVSGLFALYVGVLRTPLVRFENHVIALGVLAALLLVLSPRARAFGSRVVGSPVAFPVVAGLVAWYLSLGPQPRAGGHLIQGPRLYYELLKILPGMDGLRVPARFAMIAILFLAMAAAWGMRRVLTRPRRVPAGALLLAFSVLWLAEAWTAPLPLNVGIGSDVEGVTDPPAKVSTGDNPPSLARYLRNLPADAVLIEFPFGAGGWEMRYVYYSTFHWKRLVNGFSGFAPESYDERAKALRNPYRDQVEAWRLVLSSGATHAVVHGQAYPERLAPAPYDWLESSGARFVAKIGADEVYEIPRPRSH